MSHAGASCVLSDIMKSITEWVKNSFLCKFFTNVPEHGEAEEENTF
jgi:hypothetical protein